MTNATWDFDAGKSEDLFRYTSGRWLVDEKAQQLLRYVKFDLDSLCRLAAEHFSDATMCSRCQARRKLQQSFTSYLGR